MEKNGSLTRGEFLKCCATGACSLAAVAALPATVLAEPTNAEANWLQGQWDACRVRFAKMVGVLDQMLDEPTKRKVFQNVGRECARQYSGQTWDKYKGDIHAFLKDMQGADGWMAKAEYDEKNGVITITDKQKKCTCPLVKQGVTSAAQCLCTLGWQEETYSRMLGKPVEASIVKSVLRGDDCCVYRIKVLS